MAVIVTPAKSTDRRSSDENTDIAGKVLVTTTIFVVMEAVKTAIVVIQKASKLVVAMRVVLPKRTDACGNYSDNEDEEDAEEEEEELQEKHHISGHYFSSLC